MSAKICVNCKYYSINSRNLKQGECVRYPPIPYPLPDGLGNMGVVTVYPQIKQEQTCGEFESKLVLRGPDEEAD